MNIAYQMIKTAVTLEEMEKANKKTVAPRRIRRDIMRLDNKTAPMMGAVTVPNIPEGGGHRNKFYIKGQTSQVMKLRAKKEGHPSPFSQKISGGGKRGMNAIINNHEHNEMKHFGKNLATSGQTAVGQQFGHHSLAHILGKERNIRVKAEDKELREGGKALTRLRNSRGETEAFDKFSPKSVTGEHIKYEDNTKMNRAHRKAMFRKERFPGGGITHEERKQEMGMETKEQRRARIEAGAKKNRERKLKNIEKSNSENRATKMIKKVIGRGRKNNSPIISTLDRWGTKLKGLSRHIH